MKTNPFEAAANKHRQNNKNRQKNTQPSTDTTPTMASTIASGTNTPESQTDIKTKTTHASSPQKVQPKTLLNDEMKLLSSLSTVLSHIVKISQSNMYDEDVPDNGIIQKFEAVRPPPITLSVYLTRLASFFCCTMESFVLSIVYIDRLIKKFSETGSLFLNELNVHRMVLTAVLVSVKFYDDVYYGNDYYAKIGGVPQTELNVLETEFLRLIDYNLYVSESEYLVYKDEVLGAI